MRPLAVTRVTSADHDTLLQCPEWCWPLISTVNLGLLWLVWQIDKPVTLLYQILTTGFIWMRNFDSCSRSSGFHVLSRYRQLPSNLCLEKCVFIRWRILLTPSSVSQEKKWRQKTISNLISHYKVGPAGWAIPTAYLKHQSNMQQPFCLKHILELK